MADSLLETILSDDIDLTRFLLKAGIRANTQFADGSYPLNVAIGLRRGEIVQLLLDEGANVNQPDSFRYGVT